MNLPHTFVANTLAKAEQVNENFEAVVNEITAQGVELMANIQTVSANASSQLMTMLQTIYPVGSIYIGTMSTCPVAALFGTWTKKGEGKVLWGSDSTHEAGTTIAAGLPNITGFIDELCTYSSAAPTGAFYQSGSSTWKKDGRDQTLYEKDVHFDASYSNSIYGSSDTVQPPAYVVNIWERVA